MCQNVQFGSWQTKKYWYDVYIYLDYVQYNWIGGENDYDKLWQN